MIEVLFFGRVSDVAQARRLSMAAPTSLFDLRDRIFGDAINDGRIAEAAIKMSVNRVAQSSDQALGDGDEVAFFSVFSGG